MFANRIGHDDLRVVELDAANGKLKGREANEFLGHLEVQDILKARSLLTKTLQSAVRPQRTRQPSDAQLREQDRPFGGWSSAGFGGDSKIFHTSSEQYTRSSDHSKYRS
jgi:hypothetical protein